MKIKLNLILFGILVSATSFGQSSQLNLSEAVKIALDNNIRLKQEKNNLISNQAFLQSAKLALAPTVSASANAGSQTGNSFNQQEGQVVNGTINFVSASVGANLTIFNGFGTMNSLRSSTMLFDSQENNVLRTEQDIISDVAFQFLQTLLSQELLKIAQENLEFQKTNLQKIESEVTLGAKPEVDKFNQISIVKTSELNVLRAEVDLRNNKTSLAQFMQVDPTQDFELTLPDLNTISPQADLNTIDINAQLGNRSDIVSLQLMEESNKFQMLTTKADFMPSLVAFANYGSRYNQIVGFAGRPFDQQFFTDNTYFNYGLALNIPIFNGMANKARYTRDKIAYENSVLSRQDLEVTAKSEIQRALRNYQDAIKSYELANAALEAAQMSFNLNEESFNVGLISLVDFGQSNRDYFQARSDLISAQLTLVFQDVLLKDALGTLSVDDIE